MVCSFSDLQHQNELVFDCWTRDININKKHVINILVHSLKIGVCINRFWISLDPEEHAWIHQCCISVPNLNEFDTSGFEGCRLPRGREKEKCERQWERAKSVYLQTSAELGFIVCNLNMKPGGYRMRSRAVSSKSLVWPPSLLWVLCVVPLRQQTAGMITNQWEGNGRN